MYFYLAKVSFEPTPTSTAGPSNTEITIIPTRPLRSLKKVTRFRCANTIIYVQGIPGSYGSFSNDSIQFCGFNIEIIEFV